MRKILLLILLSIIFLGCQNFDKKAAQLHTSENDKLKSENSYLKSLLESNAKNTNILLSPIVNAYNIADTARSNKIKIFDNSNKNTLVIRYSQIGCSTCTDLFFKLLKQHEKNFKTIDQVLILADYTDYQAFLKWYKVMEIEKPVFILEKGEIPLDMEKDFDSYCFVINKDNLISSVFVPSSLFPEYMESFLEHI